MTYEFIRVGMRKMDLLKRANFEEEIVSQNVNQTMILENHRSNQPYEKALSNDRKLF